MDEKTFTKLLTEEYDLPAKFVEKLATWFFVSGNAEVERISFLSCLGIVDTEDYPELFG
jgi:hypothetical protein